MIAQYSTGKDFAVRIFPAHSVSAIMECCMLIDSLREADRVLKQCNLRRKGKWSQLSWGYEARVSWRVK